MDITATSLVLALSVFASLFTIAGVSFVVYFILSKPTGSKPEATSQPLKFRATAQALPSKKFKPRAKSDEELARDEMNQTEKRI